MIKFGWINLLRIIKDKKVLIGLFLAPVIALTFLSIFSPKEGVSSIRMGYIDEDRSSESDWLIEEMNKIKAFEVIPYTIEDAKDDIAKEYLPVAFIIPNGFSKYVNTNKLPQVEILRGEESPYLLVEDKLNKAIRDLLLYSSIHEDERFQSEGKAIISVEYISHYKPMKTGVLLGFLINFMMYSMIYIINEISDLRKWKILIRSFSTPNSGFTILGGLMLSMLVLLAIQLIIVNSFSVYVLKLPIINHIFGASLLFIPFSFLVLSLGILTAKFLKNSDLAPIIANFIIIPTGMVSGTLLPKEYIPEIITKFSFLAPQYWVYDGIDKLNNNSIISILPNIIIITLFALCFFVAGAYNFKNMLKESV